MWGVAIIDMRIKWFAVIISFAIGCGGTLFVEQLPIPLAAKIIIAVVIIGALSIGTLLLVYLWWRSKVLESSD